MPNTPNYALPYPVLTDTADVPRDIQALATAIDGISAIRPPVVTVLPASPADGQEIYLSASSGTVMWHLRYNAAAAGASKWQFVGGGSLIARVDTFEGTSSTAYTNLATAGPTVTVPVAGDYEIIYGARINTGPGATAISSIAIGATAPVDADGMFCGTNAAGASLDSGAARQLVKTALAGDAIQVRYKSLTAVNNNFGNRWLTVRPQRLG